MIEARIVEAGDSFAKNLGIRLELGNGSVTGGSARSSLATVPVNS